MNISRIWKTTVVLGIAGVVIVGCEKENPQGPDPIISDSELISKKVNAPPVIDGVIEGAWDQCDQLVSSAAVPTLSDFTYYEGEAYNFTLRSMYDENSIYFLAEWDDPVDSKDRQSWYFDTDTKLWKQQNKFPAASGDKYYEDKFAFLWPVKVDATWDNATCYSSCHSVSNDLGYTTNNKHYTNNPGDVIDMWHWKRVRSNNDAMGMVDDQRIVYIDPSNPEEYDLSHGGRGSDAKTSGGYADNKQTLNNGVKDVTVPKYVIPDEAGYSWITQAQIDNQTAKLVTGVDANGVLTYEGGTVDPSQGGYEAATGTKRIPSVYIQGPFAGSRGDITSMGTHTGTGWVVEFTRKLSTTDTENDVQFDIEKDLMFGFAIFENAAIAHGIKPNLKLRFNK